MGVTWWGGGSWIQYVQNPGYHYSHILPGLALQHWRSCIPGDEWNCYTVESLHEERENRRGRCTVSSKRLPLFLCSSAYFTLRLSLSAVFSTHCHLPSSWHRSWKEAYQDGNKLYSHFHFQRNTSHCHQIPAKLPVKGREDIGNNWITIQGNAERMKGCEAEKSSLGRLWHCTKEVLCQILPWSLCFWESA